MKGLLAIAGLLGSSCGGQVASIRAERRFAREPARLDAVRSRVEDFEAAVALSRSLLLEVPYRAGDRWPRDLAMSDDEADAIEARLRRERPYRDRDLEVPPIAIYRRHVEAVVRAPRAAGAEGRTEGIVHALPGLRPTLEALAALDAARDTLSKAAARAGALRHAGRRVSNEAEAARFRSARAEADAEVDDARSDVRAAGSGLVESLRDASAYRARARDLQAAVSAAYRLLAEANALSGVVDRDALLVVPPPDAPSRRAVLRGETGGTVSIPSRLAAATTVAAALEPAYERAGRVLERPAGRALDDAPGLASDDTLADDIGGFAWDNLFVHGRAGGELAFFSNLVDQTTDPDSDADVRFDYTGRRRFLRYHVSPIVLVGANAELGASLFRIPRFLKLKLGYGTDRFFREGGRVSRSSAASQLGITGRASDLLEGTLHGFGFDTSLRVARFDFGEVEVVDDATGRVEETFPFQLELLQIEVTYDLRHLIEPELLVGVVDSVEVGFRYLSYRLPRLLYEFEDRNPDPDEDVYALVGETDFVQNVDATYFMGGVRVRSFDDPATTSRLVLDLGFYLGAGPGRFRYPEPDVERTQTFVALMIPVRLGYKLPLMPASSVLQLDLVAAYEASLLHANTLGEGDETAEGEGEGSDEGTRVIRFGSTDVFHGPSVWLKGSL